VKENLELFAAFQGMSRRESAPHASELIELFNLQHKRDAPARFLSKGMQQKLAIACAIVRSTPLLLLDEPTLGLDVETTHELRGYVKKLGMAGKTMLLSSHDMNLIEALCDRVILINEGRVVTDDSVANLLNLFKSRAYRFTISGSLHAQQVARLGDRFPDLEISRQAESTVIDVQLPAAHDIYELIHVLEAGDAIIESIDRRDPNFEQVFLRMIEESSLERSEVPNEA
jgi:ABC-2 type transport system ATP-binding protein